MFKSSFVRHVKTGVCLVFFIMVFCPLCLAPTFAQPPVLDPEQTVNIGTGAMGFALPLATLKIGGGKDFPVNLFYGAGIQYYQQASPAGLGFSYMPGTITRKEVFVPDENNGGPDCYFFRTSNYDEAPWWYFFIEGMLIVIAIVISIVCVYVGGTPAYPIWVAVAVMNAAMNIAITAVLNYVTFGSNDYVAGGLHTKSYHSYYDTSNTDTCVHIKAGMGFINNAIDDLPDVYFITTPFINGEMRWVEGDRFVFRRTNGGNIKDKETVSIRYRNGYFYVTLADGTRLYFEKSSKSKRYNIFTMQTQEGEVYARASTINEQRQPVASMWVMTKILYSDYVDGGLGDDADEDPLNSLKTNKGSWIIFEYDEVIRDNVEQLPLCIGVGRKGTALVSTNGNLLHELCLKSIKTPYDSAEFIYSNDRKDDLWFDVSEMDWWPRQEVPLRNLEDDYTAAHVCKSKILGRDAEPIARPVLRSLNIYSLTGKKRSSVHFNTDYILKPSSLHSHTKDSDGEFKTLPGNPAAACLTLLSLEFEGADGSRYPPVSFKYVDANPVGWDKDRQMRYSCHYGKGVSYFFEEKDLWGYYCPNDSDITEFNVNGDLNRAKGAAAWSLEEVCFPTGLKIKWEYEPNCYDASNGVKGVCGVGNAPRYGGGIRVRKITAKDDISPEVTWRYVYTCDKGVFTEQIFGDTTNSSGHATTEPFNYLKDDVEYRQDTLRRGGLYTPAKIAYELVQVIKNYQEPDSLHPNGNAPEGYMAYRFLTSLDHPNGGKFGDIDSSWKRGYMVEKEAYDHANQRVSAEEYIYRFEDEVITDKGHLNTAVDSLDTEAAKFTMGIIWQETKKTMANGLSKKEDTYYKTDITDSLKVVKDTFQVLDTLFVPVGSDGGVLSFGPNESGGCLITALDEDGIKNDMIWAVIHEALTSLNLYFNYVKDIDFANGTGSFKENSGFHVFNSGGWRYDNVLGLAHIDVDKSVDINDIVIVTGFVNDFGNQVLLINYFADNDTNLFGIRELDWFPHKPFTSAVVHDFNNNGMPDLLLYSYDEPDRIVADSSTKLYIITDIQCRHSPYYTGVYESDDSLVIKSRYARMVDFDNDGCKDDLLCCGPDIPATDYRCEQERYEIGRSIIMDVNLNAETGKVSFGASRKLTEPAFKLNSDYIRSECKEGGGSSIFFGFDLDKNNDPIYSLGAYIKTKGYRSYIIRCRDSVVYRDYNGLPDQTVAYNTGDTMLVTVPFAAYENSKEMGAPETAQHKHMLTQSGGLTVYKVPPSIEAPINPAACSSMVFSAQVTNWSVFDKRYLPWTNYRWKVDMTSAGLPVTDFAPFDFLHTSANPDWVMVDSVCRYSKNSFCQSAATPVTKTKRRLATAIYGHNGALKIGAVTDALWSECGVFTGDYRDGINAAFWDFANGWEKGVHGTVTLSGDPGHCHFGDSVIFVVNDYAAGRNNRIFPGKSYEMSAWVKVESGAMLMGTDFRWIPIDKEPLWPLIGSYLTKDNSIAPIFDTVTAAESAGKWKLISIKIPSSVTSKLSADGKAWYARAWVGRDPADGSVTGCVDDVRFAPMKSMVRTTYYEPVFNQAILSVDENNKPGTRVRYDGFGRPEIVEKINPSKSRGDSGYGKIVQKKKYVLKGVE